MGLSLPRASWPVGKEAPGSLELVRRFLNSQNIENGADGWRDTVDVRQWLLGEQCDVPARLSRAEVDQLRHVRAGLRSAVSGGPLHQLTSIAAGVPLTISFDTPVRLVSNGTRIDQFIANLLVSVFASMSDGTWNRLKPCRNCQWVVFDRSKNRSASWCADHACSTRHRARAYRQRVRERSAPG